MNQKKSQQDLYNELASYTLSLQDSEFIHQYIVDAFCAQNADQNTQPIALTFALIGLYLHIEKNYSGNAVQRVHIILAQNKKAWTKFNLPQNRGEITISDVLNAPAGPKRNEEINNWCFSVWQSYSQSHQIIKELVQAELT